MTLNSSFFIKFFAVVALVMLIPDAHAQTNIGQMFANGQASFDALIKLVKFSAYIIGIFLVLGSIFKFSQIGTNPQITLKTPLTMFVAGIGIFALVGTVSIATQTLAMGSGPGDIFVQGGDGWTAQTMAAMKGVLTFIRLIGYIAFIRGWLIINQYGQGGQGAQGGLGRGITHIFGGVAAINVTFTAQILANTFAPGVPMPF